MTKYLKEIFLTTKRSKIENKPIGVPTDALDIIRQFYHDDISLYESCFMLFLNKGNKTIGYCKISQGGVANTVVDVKLCCKYAIDCLASGVILVHNHPSGNIKPGEQDLIITDKVKKALDVFDIKLIDHIIITETDYYSFVNNDIL